jgi:hypothetical protein
MTVDKLRSSRVAAGIGKPGTAREQECPRYRNVDWVRRAVASSLQTITRFAFFYSALTGRIVLENNNKVFQHRGCGSDVRRE